MGKSKDRRPPHSLPTLFTSAINRPSIPTAIHWHTNPLPAEYAQQDKRFASALQVMQDAIRDRAFPACSLAVTHKGRLVALKSLGRFTYDSTSAVLTDTSLFDIASVSKVVATTSMAMILYERGVLDLDVPVASIVPEFVNSADPRRHDVSLRMLLAHSSGLPAYAKLFMQANSPETLLEAVFTTELTAEPGARAEYSDIGFIILGVALTRLADESLEQFCRREIFGPLAMVSTTYNPATTLRSNSVPTADDQTFRHRVIQGEVQDENASVLGGVAGHAGLFSTATDIARFAMAMLNIREGNPSPGNSGGIHEPPGTPCGNFPCTWMGHAFSTLAIRQISVPACIRSPRIHRHLPMDRSRARALYNAPHEQNLARLQEPKHPRGSAPLHDAIVEALEK